MHFFLCDKVVCAHYIAKWMIALQKDINATDFYGRTPLQLLIERRTEPAFIVWMYLKGARTTHQPIVRNFLIFPLCKTLSEWPKA